MRRARESPGTFNVWPAFTDVLGGVVVVLIFLITIFVIGEVLIGREITGKDTAIGQLGRIVEHIESLLGDSEKENQRLKVQLGLLENRLRERDDQQADMERRISESQQQTQRLELALSETRSDGERLREALARTEGQAQAEKARSEGQIASLSDHLKHFAEELERLNRALYGSREALDESRADADGQRAALTRAEQRIAALEAAAADQDREVTQGRSLIAEQQSRIEEMDRLIKKRLVERVEELEQYSSDFFGRLRQVFADNPDIKVEGDRFVFQSEVLFTSGESDLSGGGRGDLDKFAQVYQQVASQIPKDLPVIIEVQGHTDKVPIRTARYRSNWELSTQRALGVVNYLIERGIPPNRLAAVGMGEFHPVDTSENPQSYRRNRRIELKITSR